MPATREQVYAALKAADASGNVADAKQLARQYASMPADAPAAPTASKPESYGDAAKRAAWNLPRSLLDVVPDTLEGVGGMIAHPVKTYDAARDFASKAADVLKGGAQKIRELSPEGNRGSAPALDTTAYDKAVGDAKETYGSGHKVASRIADDPAGMAIAAASLLNPALRATGVGAKVGEAASAVASLPGRVVRPAVSTVRKITGAERRGNAAASQMRDEANDTLSGGRTAALADVAAAEARASDAAKSSTRGRRFADTLAERRAAAAREAVAPELDVGTPRNLSEMGDEVRAPALAKQGEIEAQMREADNKYRTAMEEVAADREAAGVGVSDSATAKLLIKRSKQIVKPDPVKRPGVGNTPADSAGGRLHEDLLKVLEPQEVPLTVKEAAAARKAGIKVNVAPDGSFTRTIKPSLKNVEDFSRRVGKILEGKIEGYEAINRIEAGQMYANLQKVMDKYVKGARAPVQKNWRDGKAALAPFEEVRAGQRLVGTQGAGEAAVPAANIPGQVLAGGRDTVRQTAAVAGEAPTASMVRSQVQNQLAGAKSSADVENLLRGTKLGDVVASDADLAERVASYTQRLKASEAAAGQVTSLERRATLALKRADRLANRSSTATERAARAKDIAKGYERDISALEIADPQEVGARYTAMLDKAHKEGLIDTAKYQQGLKLAARAEKDFRIKNARKKWIRYAGYMMGGGVAAGLGADIVSTVKD